jgi:hypothetical protein
MTDQRRRMLVDGLIAGVVGYAVVAAFHVLLNMLGGRPPLYTAAVLGELVFGRGGEGVMLGVDPTLVLAFNGVQLVALLAFGFFAAWLMYEAELHPELWYVAFFLFLAATVVGFASVLVVTMIVGSVVSPWLMVASSLLGAAAIAAYLALTHRRLLGSVGDLAAPVADGAER